MLFTCNLSLHLSSNRYCTFTNCTNFSPYGNSTISWVHTSKLQRHADSYIPTSPTNGYLADTRILHPRWFILRTPEPQMCVLLSWGSTRDFLSILFLTLSCKICLCLLLMHPEILFLGHKLANLQPTLWVGWVEPSTSSDPVCWQSCGHPVGTSPRRAKGRSSQAGRLSGRPAGPGRPSALGRQLCVLGSRTNWPSGFGSWQKAAFPMGKHLLGKGKRGLYLFKFGYLWVLEKC